MSGKNKDGGASPADRPGLAGGLSQGRIVSMPDKGRCLDPLQLERLEHSFRRWCDDSPRADVRLARRRILIIFLLIRYTGAKLSEVLALDPFEDIDPVRQSVRFRGVDAGGKKREVQISASLADEIGSSLADPAFSRSLENLLDVDPGFVRRKFYERAHECGFSKRMSGPEMIRKARAVELLQANLPLPAVQMLLGHSTPNLTASYVSFSEAEIRQITRFFMEREASRKTSARNAFFGKVQAIRRGDIQALVELATVGGLLVTTVITNDSLARLGLKAGSLVTAEVKAPWVTLHQGEDAPASSAENCFNGVVVRHTQGKVNTEIVLRLADGTHLCSIVTTGSSRRLGIEEGGSLWALFSSFAVVLHVE